MRHAVKLSLVLAVILGAIQAQAQAPAVAPAPGGAPSPCTLPSGQEILAPQASGTAQQYISYYYSYSWSYYVSYYYSNSYYYYYGRKLLQAPARAPSSNAPRCCPTTVTKQGDTVDSLISAASLPADSKSFFYALNPNVSNTTDTIPAGTNTTLPCYRITQYYYLLARAPAPAVAGA